MQSDITTITKDGLKGLFSRFGLESSYYTPLIETILQAHKGEIKLPSKKEYLLKRSVQLWGIKQQIGMVHEEIGELLQAINKIHRMGGMQEWDRIMPPHKHSSVKYSLAYFALCSEVADCKIMLQQLENMLDKEAVELSEERKLIKLEKLIEISEQKNNK